MIARRLLFSPPGYVFVGFVLGIITGAFWAAVFLIARDGLTP